MLISLKPGTYNGIAIKPRWPARQVQIDSDVFGLLQLAAEQLSPGIGLILTRGYENPRGVPGKLRGLLRIVGKKLFILLYPSRRPEVAEIFTPNGHDMNGRHVDIGIVFNGRELKLLPYGVFTSNSQIRREEELHREVIAKAKECITSLGGTFHLNRLEALQMHIDF